MRHRTDSLRVTEPLHLGPATRTALWRTYRASDEGGEHPLEDPVSELDRTIVPVPRPASWAEALLRAGIPLSLLLDLAGSDPHSDELYALERAS